MPHPLGGSKNNGTIRTISVLFPQFERENARREIVLRDSPGAIGPRFVFRAAIYDPSRLFFLSWDRERSAFS